MAEKLNLEEFSEDFALFVEAGFMAVNQKDEVNSRRLFEAAKILRPESPAPTIGLGYIALNKLEVKKASTLFQQALEIDPEHHLAQTFLGISYLLVESKRQEGEKLIKDAMKKTEDPTIVNLGKVSLEWAEKDLKKKSSLPFFSQEEEGKEGEEENVQTSDE